jgi:hypothetical protein
MTGEMHAIDQRGRDSNGATWPVHAAIARSVKGRLEPFDVYQGPYIVVGPELTAGNPPYRCPLPGAVRLWVGIDGLDDVTGIVYREDTDQQAYYYPAWDTRRACRAARSLL